MTNVALHERLQPPDIVVGQMDHRRLTTAALTDITYHADEVDFLFYKLDRANVVVDDALPGDVVRLNSIVRYRTKGGTERTVKLVLPDDQVRDNAYRLAATSMHGAALLGLRPGQARSWLRPDGEAGQVEVVSVANSLSRSRHRQPANC
jgi:regulator of nucleoside diphosphate kinase